MVIQLSVLFSFWPSAYHKEKKFFKSEVKSVIPGQEILDWWLLLRPTKLIQTCQPQSFFSDKK